MEDIFANTVNEVITEINNGDAQKGAALLKKCADGGNADAMYYLGYLFYKGNGVPKNYKKALSLFEKASNRGNTKASFILGNMLISGNGCDKSPEKAAEVWEEGAKRGNVQCAYNLAMLCDRGLGVRIDKAKSISLLRFCAENGMEKAKEILDKITVKQDNTENINELISLAEKGDAKALYRLGVHKMRGTKVAKNKTEATNLFIHSAKQNYFLACVALFNRYYIDEELEKIWSCAEYWLARSIELDKARFNIVHPNIVKAVEIFGNAQKENDKEIIAKMLVSCIENGFHGAFVPLGDLQENENDAYGFYLKGANAGDATAYLRLYDIYSNKESPLFNEAKASVMLEKHEQIAKTVRQFSE